MVRVEYLSQEGFKYVSSAPDSALMYFKQSEILAREENDSSAMLKSIFDMGHFMMGRGIFGQALDYMFSGEQLAKARNDTSRYIFFLYWKSRVYNELGEFEKSLEACEAAMAYGDEVGSGWALNYYGEALRGAGQLEAARDSLLVAEAIFKEEKESIGSLMVWAKLAHVFQELKDPEMTRKYASKVLGSWERMRAYESFMTASTSMMEMHMEAGQLDSAEQVALHALQVLKGKKYYRSMARMMNLLAIVYERKEDPENALKYIRESAALADEYELDKVKVNLAVRDSEFLNERLKANNALLQAEKNGQVYLMIGLGALLLLFLLAGIMLFRSNRKGKEFNEILSAKNRSLDELNQEKDMLMQIVAHDLKAPLNSVKGLNEMLKAVGPLNETQLVVLEKMDFAVDRGVELIKNLLELSAIEHGQMKPRPIESRLSESLQAIISQYKTQAERKSIDIRVDIPGEPILLKTDPSHYERIVDNLISNAIKYSPKGMRVWVELKQQQDQVYTVIRDEGPGISKADQEKLFRKFQRLSAQPTGGESSNGLGLAIVKAFAEQMGGEIKVNSTEGKGAEFILCLPATA